MTPHDVLTWALTWTTVFFLGALCVGFAVFTWQVFFRD